MPSGRMCRIRQTGLDQSVDHLEKAGTHPNESSLISQSKEATTPGLRDRQHAFLRERAKTAN